MSAQDRLQRLVSNHVIKSPLSVEVISDIHATITGRIVIGRVVSPHKDREDMPITKQNMIAYNQAIISHRDT